MNNRGELRTWTDDELSRLQLDTRTLLLQLLTGEITVMVIASKLPAFIRSDEQFVNSLRHGLNRARLSPEFQSAPESVFGHKELQICVEKAADIVTSPSNARTTHSGETQLASAASLAVAFLLQEALGWAPVP